MDNIKCGKYTWTVNNGRIGWAASESLLEENTNQKGTNYKWEMRKVSAEDEFTSTEIKYPSRSI